MAAPGRWAPAVPAARVILPARGTAATASPGSVAQGQRQLAGLQRWQRWRRRFLRRWRRWRRCPRRGECGGGGGGASGFESSRHHAYVDRRSTSRHPVDHDHLQARAHGRRGSARRGHRRPLTGRDQLWRRLLACFPGRTVMTLTARRAASGIPVRGLVGRVCKGTGEMQGHDERQQKRPRDLQRNPRQAQLPGFGDRDLARRCTRGPTP